MTKHIYVWCRRCSRRRLFWWHCTCGNSMISSGSGITQCYSCSVGDWQAAHPDCAACCPVQGAAAPPVGPVEPSAPAASEQVRRQLVTIMDQNGSEPALAVRRMMNEVITPLMLQMLAAAPPVGGGWQAPTREALEQLIQSWRDAAERHDRLGDTYRRGQGWGLIDCAKELEALLPPASMGVAVTREEPCNSGCNPYIAACGAKFCTYEEMAAHRCQPDDGETR